MKKKLCYVMSTVLALSICMPGGALQAIADEGATAPAAAENAQGNASTASPQEAEASSQVEDGVESSASANQAEGQEAPAPVEKAQPAPNDEQAAPDEPDASVVEGDPQADATQDSPSDEANPEGSTAKKAKAPMRAPASGSIITSASLSRTDFNDNGSVAQLTMGFSLPDGQFSAGGTSTIQLPAGFKFRTDYDFDVKSSDGATVAQAHMDAAAGTLTLTYTDYVDTHSDITPPVPSPRR